MDLERFKNYINNNRKVRTELWSIKYEGEAIVLMSGKFVWKKRGHAVNAFINFIDSLYTWTQIREFGFKDGKEMAHHIINSEIITIELI